MLTHVPDRTPPYLCVQLVAHLAHLVVNQVNEVTTVPMECSAPVQGPVINGDEQPCVQVWLLLLPVTDRSVTLYLTSSAHTITHTHTHIHTHTHTYTHTPTRTQLHLPTTSHPPTPTRTHLLTHLPIHTHTHTHTHTHPHLHTWMDGRRLRRFAALLAQRTR
jgi:hypothetical protein